MAFKVEWQVLLLCFSFQSAFLMWPVPLCNLLPFDLSLLSPYRLSFLFYWSHIILHVIKYAQWFFCLFSFFPSSFHIHRELFLQCFQLGSFPLLCRIFSETYHFSHGNISLAKKGTINSGLIPATNKRCRLPLILFLTTCANGSPFPKSCTESKQFQCIGSLTSRCKLLHTEWIHKKVPLYSTGTIFNILW